MHFLLTAVCLMTTMATLVSAWYNKMDNTVYGGWAPDRRSLTSCKAEGDTCLVSRQCCGEFAVCRKDSRFGFGECETKSGRSSWVPGGAEVGTKKKNEECVDSFECADQCCRLVRLGRVGYRQSCGKPRGYVCVGRQEVPAASNDIFGNY